MAIFMPKESDFILIKIKEQNIKMLSKMVYDSFDSSILGLGDIKKASVATDAIAAVFDLAGFTNFCKQIEPHLSVPIFLSQFLDWLIGEIKKEMTIKTYVNGNLKLYQLWDFKSVPPCREVRG